MSNTAVEKFSSLATSTKKRTAKRITVNLALDEAENLEKYCEQTGKTVTDVIEELIRSLP
ncbi:CopG family transcriptional regulator [Nostoc linckia z18]|jgi:predicted DNA-binding protein|uniref:Protein CopB n=2 Tax=Nostoc linckia TaxID=92942 RepID=A0A9Q6ELK3_NOSLI|nr:MULTISPECIES: RepB family protein [Nostoc]PHK41033.1 CopG family transcriptional regulator [Nostoc linckia z15]PHK45726.1 CopG family transcriptional regulator [Nostoc linckia z16]MBC1236488.1 CopG family transcriptional regulator [Nostoc sp. 2RC]PHJ65257.1 CopG family transcriptional regulator [Nostoc linckia z1]PHJ70286.1 CopG family transcriptional regulator [Nostoc linckia z3]